MIVFCLLWLPLFCLFWRAVSPAMSGKGGIIALLLGSIAALVQFFLGSIVNPGGFGFSRWLGGLVDIVVAPAVLPLVVALFFLLFRVYRTPEDFTHFSLLWLIPGGAMRTFNWSTQNDPAQLILVPLLWTSLVTGIPFFFRLIFSGKWYAIIPALAGLCILPLSSASSYWAFFSQKYELGITFFGISMIPLICATASAYYRAAKHS
ncbi:MAG: hypothetical protein LBP76_05250 [Treponema sp.]|jgi:hypothetical protein|nr:hypothetical protein [Treponema sp.]